MEETEDIINQTAFGCFGIRYVFPFQRLVISNIFRAARIPDFEIDPSFEEELTPDQIILLPTGSGKSLCFMLPAFHLKGITLVIFPLLSLLADQLRRTEEAGLKAVLLRGGQSEQNRRDIFEKCRKGEIKMILTNPETLSVEPVLKNLETLEIDHVVIDEAHTVSEWGDSFRPAYLKLGEIIERLSPAVITAFTATASTHILNRIRDVLFQRASPNIIFGNPDRTNIHYRVIQTLNPERTIVETVKNTQKPLIVFSSSRTETEITARLLRREMNSHDIYFYHAGLSREEKEEVESWFFRSEKGVLVATCAYGMGVDKANVRTVIHMNPPATVEAYLQESGRAGRDRNAASAILVYSPGARVRLEKIKKTPAGERYHSMINYCENSVDCRRETLLSMLNSEPEICNGCDVCDRVIHNDESHLKVLSIIRLHKRRFTSRTLIDFLKGYRTTDIRDRFLYTIDGFGVLSDWNREMIEELIHLMTESGIIRILPKGPWKYRITI